MIHAGFALTGVVTTLLGPILPILTAQWSLNDAQAGRVFTAQFVSAVVGSFIGSRTLGRWGAARTVVAGMLIVGAGVAALGAPDAVIGYAGICTYGVGLGLALPATNLLVADLVPEKRVAALNILNFSWTAGALSGPLLVSYAQQRIGFRTFSVLLATTVAVIAILEFAALPKVGSLSAPVQSGKLVQEYRLKFAALTCLFLMLYVGVENGFSGWLAVLAGRIFHTSITATAIVQSSFWGAVLAGRLMAPVIVRIIRPSSLVFGGLAGAAGGIVLTVAARNVAGLEIGVLLCGLGMAALFPTVVAIFTEWCGTGGAGAIVIGVCGLGGALVPMAVGSVAAHSSRLRVGMTVNFWCVLLAIAVFWSMQTVIRLQSNKPAAQ